MKKYVLTNDTIKVYKTVLHRIKAAKSFSDVEEGDFGGWIEKESNLSQDGNAWVAMNARVYGDAEVSENACVFGNAEVSENACVYGDARVYGDAEVLGDARVYGDAEVFGNAKVHGDAEVLGDARVYGDAEVSENACVFGNACVYQDAKVHGDAEVYGDAEVLGDAEITSMSDYMVFKNTWSSGRYFTYTLSNKKWKVGCFYGTGDELIDKAYRDSELKGKCYEATVKYAEKIAKLVRSGKKK